MARAIVNVPATARRGEIIEIKAMVAHNMETGFRRTQTGELIPRDIITRFVCTYAGAEIFSAEFNPAIAANPYLAFTTRVADSGAIVCTWTGDNGYAHTESVSITVA